MCSGPGEWASLAEIVEESYFDYDGFVILHGTDTMAYTASALSFMLQGLGKPVVLTGSIIPMCEVYNDARRNLIVSVMFAAQLELPEVLALLISLQPCPRPACSRAPTPPGLQRSAARHATPVQRGPQRLRTPGGHLLQQRAAARQPRHQGGLAGPRGL